MNTGRERYRTPSTRNRQLAKSLRGNLTPHEKIIWRALRERLPQGLAHFRRQVAIGPYVVDFCDLKSRLVIEIDGHQHGEDAARRRDEIRDAFLAGQSFRVLRFSNADVQHRIDEVLDTVFAVLSGANRQDP